MVKGGQQTYFPLAVFQFLPAFLTTALRRAARHAHQPLHSLTWAFHLTDQPSPPLPHLPVILSPDTHSDPASDQVSESASCPPADTAGPFNTPEQQSGSPTDATPDIPDNVNNTSQETPCETPVNEVEEEEGQSQASGAKEEEEEVWSCWGQDRSITLLASGLWLVGASWNAERYVWLACPL